MHTDPMMPKPGTWIVGLLALGTAAGCTQVAEISRPGFNPRQYPTFAFLPRPNPSVQGRNDPAERVRQTVARELRAKGYRSTTPDRASFVVSFYTNLAGPLAPGDLGYDVQNWERDNDQAIAADATRDATTDRGRWEIGTLPDSSRYVNMLVVIDVVDRRAHDLIWRGWARNKTPPSEVSIEELADIAADVLSQFPQR